MPVVKLGDGLAVRLPPSVVEAFGLREGDEVEVHPVSDRAADQNEAQRDKALATLLDIAGKYSLPSGYKFDRDELHDR